MMARRVFYENGSGQEFWIGIVWAIVWSILAARVGLGRGNGLSRVQR